MAGTDERFLASGDEAGTPPGDRAFRPDVEGLRAVAILLVVLFHVGIPQVRGGFVGVDVFFVISGFVITGLLLRERRSSGRTSFAAFYARRARRILPAAMLVIVVSLVGSAVISDHGYAGLVASDARWCAVFLANVHFAHVYPNYLVPRPQSPLGQYWSLAIEEQFYLVYPAFFVALLASRSRRVGVRRVALGLGVAAVASLVLSIVWTHTGQLAAYDSTLTRVWELAAGALIALGIERFERLPAAWATAMTWAGMLGIVVAAAAYSTFTPYPGIAVALPVLSAALVIVGGTARPPRGAELVLATSPFRWVGRWSYSWYLWHWPLLVLAAQAAHTTTNQQGIALNLVIVAVALGVAALTYSFVENPVRHWSRLMSSPRATLVGAGLLIAGVVALTFAF
jgi:peptidoglycan/LPS O-acetylase OafA/YrhL